MIEQVPDSVNVLTAEIGAALIGETPPWESSRQALRCRTLELAIKMIDPDTEAPLLAVLILADALEAYIDGGSWQAAQARWLHNVQGTPAEASAKEG